MIIMDQRQVLGQGHDGAIGTHGAGFLKVAIPAGGARKKAPRITASLVGLPGAQMLGAKLQTCLCGGVLAFK